MATSATTDLRPVLTLAEAAEFLRVSERTLWSQVKAGEVPCFRLGKQYRFSLESLEQWCRDKSGDRRRC